MSIVAKVLTLAAACALPAAAPACSQGVTQPSQASGQTAPKLLDPPLTESHKRGLAYAAVASVLDGRSHKYPEAIEQWRLALKEEPSNRQWQQGLAFSLHRANRTPEAIAIWKKLALGDDDIAKRSAKWLKKTATPEAPSK